MGYVSVAGQAIKVSSEPGRQELKRIEEEFRAGRTEGRVGNVHWELV